MTVNMSRIGGQLGRYHDGSAEGQGMVENGVYIEDSLRKLHCRDAAFHALRRPCLAVV